MLALCCYVIAHRLLTALVVTSVILVLVDAIA
jgi:hypothetical protein